jgi:hypothetical protein
LSNPLWSQDKVRSRAEPAAKRAALKNLPTYIRLPEYYTAEQSLMSTPPPEFAFDYKDYLL